MQRPETSATVSPTMRLRILLLSTMTRTMRILAEKCIPQRRQGQHNSQHTSDTQHGLFPIQAPWTLKKLRLTKLMAFGRPLPMVNKVESVLALKSALTSYLNFSHITAATALRPYDAAIQGP